MQKIMSRATQDLSGKVFGHLTVLKKDHIGPDRRWYYLCQCDCGKKSVVRSNALPTIKGWVARDKDGTLCFYSGAKPWRYERMFYDDPHQHGEGDVMRINGALFPDLKWEDEPKKVSVTIKAE